MNFVKLPSLLNGVNDCMRASVTGIACMMILGLTACGGGGSSTPSTTTPVQSLITAGAYKENVNDPNWVGIVLPNEPSSAGISNFYVLHYKDGNPDIYSGSGQITGKNEASLAQIKLYPYQSSVRAGTVTLSSSSSGNVQAVLNFPEAGAVNTSATTIGLIAPTGYVYNSAASLGDVQGNWQGSFSFGVGSVSNNAFSINISSLGAISSYMSFSTDCQLTQAVLTPNFDGTNLFRFSAKISDGTYCAANSLANLALTGAAFVTPSPVAGKTQRLYLVGVTTDGRGVSFKADR